MNKSYVTLEQNVCLVCGKLFDTGSLLFDRRLRDQFEHKTTTGWSLCPSDQEKKDQGYIALIGCKNAGIANGATLKLQDADRTGTIIHIKTDAFRKVFNIPAPERGILFVDEEVITYLTNLAKATEGGN